MQDNLNNLNNNTQPQNLPPRNFQSNINPLGNLGFSGGGAVADDGSSKKKKIIIGAAIALVLLLIAGGVYYFVSRKNTQNNLTDNSSVNFPNISDNGNQYFTEPGKDINSSNASSTTNTYSSLLKIWDLPVLAYNYKREKRVEVINATYVDPTASGTEASVTQQTREIEVEMIYFVDAATGNIYKREIDGKVNTQPEKVSKTNVTGITSATFNSDTSRLAIIKGHNLIIDSVSSVQNGSYNDGNIIDTNVSRVYPNNFNSDFIYTKQEGAGTTIYKYDTASSRTINLGSIPLTSFSIQWTSKDIYIITNPANNDSQKILTYNPATARLSSYYTSGSETNLSGDNILMSQKGVLFYKSVSGKSLNLEVNTFANKCIFLLDTRAICGVPSVMLDNNIENWYKGASYFLDSIYMINYATGYYKNILDLQNGNNNQNIDIVNPKLGSADKMIFQNKLDRSLWSLDLNQYLSDTSQTSF